MTVPDPFKEFLVIARNRVPVELFSKTFLENYGIVRHYSEERVFAEEERRQKRHDIVMELGDRIRILLFKDWQEIEMLEVSSPLAQWSDATGGAKWSPQRTKRLCEELERQWQEKIVLWKPSESDTLPDCWFFFSKAWMVRSETNQNCGWDGVIAGIDKTLNALQKAKNRQEAQEAQNRNVLLNAYTEWHSGMRVFKVSPAYTGARYAGYEMLGGNEKLEALEHLKKIIPRIHP